MYFLFKYSREIDKSAAYISLTTGALTLKLWYLKSKRDKLSRQDFFQKNLYFILKGQLCSDLQYSWHMEKILWVEPNSPLKGIHWRNFSITFTPFSRLDESTLAVTKYSNNSEND